MHQFHLYIKPKTGFNSAIYESTGLFSSAELADSESIICPPL